jgi:hypothetical protein
MSSKSPKRQLLIVLAPIAAICWLLFGPSLKPTYGYRYKLTIEVDTPEGVKRGHNIVQVRFPNQPRNGAESVKGDALYLDLGPGRRPLIALVGKYNPEILKYMRVKGWHHLSPTGLLIRYLRIDTSKGPEWIENLKTKREVIEIQLDELPTLVTFTDPSIPRTILEVDPHEPSLTLGAGVSIRRATIEITDAPLTTGIEKKLPWLVGDQPLHGYLVHRGNGFLADRGNGFGRFPLPIRYENFMLRMH